MANYKELFRSYLDREGVLYTNEEYCLKVAYSGANMSKIPVLVFFDEQNAVVRVRCCEICNLGRNESFGLRSCNEANAQYPWVKFYMDQEGNVISGVDAYLEEHTCGRECLELVRKLARITDEAYRIFVGEIWA